MDSKRWDEVQKLFEKALEINPSERESFLKSECGDDEELFDEVTSLLSADEKQHSIFSASVSDYISIDDKSLSGKIFGNYRAVEQIGSGGMGSVYLAERADGQFEQKVALKIIKPGMNSQEIVSRFEEERQILARLQHPNIARLLDGGISDQGLPYFTMEYVDGLPITQFCDNKNLSINERLELFVKVCDAVMYAHQNLVIHRDIKPGNILVQEDGTVKLLDFGIAKVFEEDEKQKFVTRTGIRVMTPEFASPEQVRGETVSTATDVYSLGMVLYHLLTGYPPYKVDTTSAIEMEKVICLTEPTKPSTMLTKISGLSSTEEKKLSPEYISQTRKSSIPKLKKIISGDLDNICLMALRKEPSRRYNSVALFITDIRNHLNGLPVIARKSTAAYRANKFIQRHKIGVAVTSISLIVIAAVTTFYFIQLAKERDKAELEAEKSRKVSEFLAGLFEVSDPLQSKGKDITARELLDNGARKIEVEMKDEPEVQAMMLDVIGRVYRTLGIYDKAESYLLEGLTIRKNILDENDPDLALSYFNLGEMYHYKNDYVKAEEYYRKALEIREAAYGSENLDVAYSIDLIGRLERDKRNFHLADSLARVAMEIRLKLTNDSDYVIVDSYHSLAMLADINGNSEEAERFLRKEAAILKREGKEYPAFLSNFAQTLSRNSKFIEADSIIKKALEVSREYYGEEHPYFANTLEQYALFKNDLGFSDTALVIMNSVIEIRKKVFGEKSKDYTLTLNNVGRMYYNLNQYDKSIEYFKEAIKISYEIGDTISAEGNYVANLAKSQYAAGQYQNSISSWEAVLKTDTKDFGHKHPYVAEDIAYIAKINSLMGNTKKAEELYRKSLDSYPLAVAMLGLGQILTANGSIEESDTLLRGALEILIERRPERHHEISEAQTLLAENLIAQQKYDEAEKLLLESYTNLLEKKGKDDQLTTNALNALIKNYKLLGKQNKADEYNKKLNVTTAGK
jgi:serine/threonine-protein kinase